jgi:hypothetical protein
MENNIPPSDQATFPTNGYWSSRLDSGLDASANVVYGGILQNAATTGDIDYPTNYPLMSLMVTASVA